MRVPIFHNQTRPVIKVYQVLYQFQPLSTPTHTMVHFHHRKILIICSDALTAPNSPIFNRLVQLIHDKEYRDIVTFSADQHAFIITHAPTFESTIVPFLFGTPPGSPALLYRFFRIMRYHGFRKQTVSRHSFCLTNLNFELPPRAIKRWQVTKFRAQIECLRSQSHSLTECPAADFQAESRKLFFSLFAEIDLFLALLD